MNELEVTVRPCDPPLRAHAIRVLYESLPADQQAAFVQAIDGLADAAHDAWQGLLVAIQEGQLISALWVQLGAGRTATVWPPLTQDVVARALLAAARRYVDASGVGLTQILLPTSDLIDPQLLAETGFPRLVDLIYLFAEASARRGLAPVRSDVQFEPRAGENRDRLGDVLQQTYIGSLDCPVLDASRPIQDVIDAYLAQGAYAEELWHFVRSENQDVGVLLLSEHPGTGNCELIYMGITPGARGRGLGRYIACRALEIAADRGAQCVVLAVDADNSPAIDAYRDAGYREWDRRRVYGRLAPGRST